MKLQKKELLGIKTSVIKGDVPESALVRSAGNIQINVGDLVKKANKKLLKEKIDRLKLITKSISTITVK